MVRPRKNSSSKRPEASREPSLPQVPPGTRAAATGGDRPSEGSAAEPLTEGEALLIDVIHARLGGTFYDALGVRPDASVATIQAAYVELSQRFHPDRYLRRANSQRLFQLEAIYRMATAAMRTLGDPQHRATYDASLRRFQKGIPSSLPKAPKADDGEGRRGSSRPPGESVDKLAALLDDTRVRDSAGRRVVSDVAPAVEVRRVVTDGVPVPEMRRPWADSAPGAPRLARSAAATSPDRHAAIARQHERAKSWSRAVAAWKDGCKEHPTDVSLHLGLVNAACEGLVDLADATVYARRAAQLAPKSARAAASLARALLLEGNAQSARRVLATALALDPTDALATELAQRLRIT